MTTRYYLENVKTGEESSRFLSDASCFEAWGKMKNPQDWGPREETQCTIADFEPHCEWEDTCWAAYRDY